MAQICKKEVETPIQCSAVKFYEVYRKKAYLLPIICPLIVTNIKLADHTSSWDNQVGSRKHVDVKIYGKPEQFKDEVVMIMDEAKKITFNVLEGDMMRFYDVFKATLEVKGCIANRRPDTAKWTVEFQKKNDDCPDPVDYLIHLAIVDVAVDAYLRAHPN